MSRHTTLTDEGIEYLKSMELSVTQALMLLHPQGTKDASGT